MEFFSGYIETKNKTPMKKGKIQNNSISFEEATKLDEYAGILSEDVILVDVDDFGQSEILLDIIDDLGIKCRVYETTRGKHFLFKNTIVKKNGTHLKLAVGLEADIKLGTKNSFEVLKYKNKLRPIIYDKLDDEEYDELPKWLIPIKTNVDFLNMEKGDGRNQTLFNYILTLQANDFNKKQATTCIELINKYILKEPLSERELGVILRDEAFPEKEEIFFNGATFLFDVFAKYLKNNYAMVKINNQLHIYQDGIYTYGGKKIEAEMIKHISRLSKSKRKEVYDYLDLIIDKNVIPSSADYIAFKNGIYNIEYDEFEEFNPNLVITNRINWDYNPDAYCEIVDKTLDKLACGDKQIRMLLEESIGYCFYRRNELRKAFILTGEKRNGKSTFLSMLLHLIGEENTTALDLSELGKDFKTAEVFGKLANIGDDIGDEFIGNLAIFRKLVSGDTINARRLYGEPFDFSCYAKFFFSANTLPRFRDKTGSNIDRLVVIPFNARFSKEDADYDPFIKDKLCSKEAMEYLIVLGLKALKRLLTNYAFTISQKVEKEIDDYNEMNNPILLFFKEVGETEIVNQVTKDVFLRYTSFCSLNNFNPLSNIEFSKQIKKHFNLDIIDKKIEGKKYRIFIKKEN